MSKKITKIGKKHQKNTKVTSKNSKITKSTDGLLINSIALNKVDKLKEELTNATNLNNKASKATIDQITQNIAKLISNSNLAKRGSEIAETEQKELDLQKFSIEKLAKIIANKIKDKDSAISNQSYSVDLYNSGINSIIRKIGEESTEVIIAAFDNHYSHSQYHQREVIKEVCDLIYHLLLLLASQNIDFSLINQELEYRNNNNKSKKKK